MKNYRKSEHFVCACNNCKKPIKWEAVGYRPCLMCKVALYSELQAEVLRGYICDDYEEIE